MEFNVFKYRAQLQKMYEEGSSDAKARLNTGISVPYFGDELVAKVRKHDGTYFYYVRDCVIEEILEYFATLKEVREAVYNWDNVTGKPKHITHKDELFMRFVAGLNMSDVYFESLVQCHKGQAFLNFYRDPEAKRTTEAEEEIKTAVSSLWGY